MYETPKVDRIMIAIGFAFLAIAWAALALLLYGVCFVFVHTLGHFNGFDGTAFFARHYLYFLLPSAVVSAVTVYLGTR